MKALTKKMQRFNYVPVTILAVVGALVWVAHYVH
jgi:hypothetical protein